MSLTLRIDNYDKLSDGGPVSFVVTERGAQIGRSTAMDWTLPDPDRHISSHHFDITFENGQYFLTDTSTNGLFMDGSRHRLAAPHPLQNGQRFQVGHYYIVVDLGAAAQPAAPSMPPAAAPASNAFAADADPWAIGGGPATPINPNPTPQRNPFDDFAGEFLVNPTPSAPPPQPAAPVAPPPAASEAASGSPFGQAPASSGSPFSSPPIATPPAAAPMGVPAAAPPPSGIAQPPVPSFTPPPQPAAAPAAVPGLQQSPMSIAPTSGGSNFMKAFCEGAGLPADFGDSADQEAFARELGRSMRVISQELMSMLQDRASAKQFTKGGERTMMGAAENNPLKFLPDAVQALEVMYMKPRPGFMAGGKGIETALSDVRKHQMAVFAAIQPALLKLLEDLAPESIDADTGGGLLGGSGKRKAWDTYVERWDAKVDENENGMLGAFLKHFAESYVAAVKSSQG
ncbi:type VI secretion system-associated FHA domain protein TagH (plasmid) [Rhodobacteraceae bacterium S2214]|nr:type VI secretion system-associated FHA domain protein TagH [Rhodobacteraceae bacterium S2214]